MCQTFASTQTFQATQALMDEPLTKQYMQAQERPKRLQKPNSSSLARSPLLGRGRRISVYHASDQHIITALCIFPPYLQGGRGPRLAMATNTAVIVFSSNVFAGWC
jgi:hypothetical protein